MKHLNFFLRTAQTISKFKYMGEKIEQKAEDT